MCDVGMHPGQVRHVNRAFEEFINAETESCVRQSFEGHQLPFLHTPVRQLLTLCFCEVPYRDAPALAFFESVCHLDAVFGSCARLLLLCSDFKKKGQARS